jgi:NAD-dependent dihydropyrimidine dehydrogenase PreA subunit
MEIDKTKCIMCLKCIPYCPVGCISERADSVEIERDECVECGVCLRVAVCPVQAIYRQADALEYPRAIRMQFSDPGAQHPGLKAWGRGTEEAKTNDVSAKFKRGHLGMLFEFGRPVTGTRFTEVEKITTAIRAMGIEILEDNPIFGLFEDPKTGKIKKEFRNEKILSAIVEILFEESRLAEVIDTIFPLFETLETVVSVGLVTRFEEDGSLPVIAKVKAKGLEVRPNAKINVGLGRPLIA